MQTLKGPALQIMLAGLAVFGATAPMAAAAPADVTVVAGGKPLAVIVVDKVASEQVKDAAKVLQRYVQKSTGATLPIADGAGSSVAINVGQTAYVKSLRLPVSELDHDGFILQGGDAKNFVVVGGSDTGTEYAVYDFLERYLGVRWLLPGELGEDVPRQDTLSLPATRVAENPAYLLRYFWTIEPAGQAAGDPYPRYPSWGRQNRLNDFDRIRFHHNLLHLFPPSQFARSNPEFYPLIDGKRYIPKDDSDEHWQPNFSAPGIVEAAAARIEKYFAENPRATSYSLGINDHPGFDQSPASRARRSGKKNSLGLEDVSDDYFRWANAVVEKVLLKYPDKWFGFLAYSEIFDPPTAVPVHPRLIPFLTYERLFWLDPVLKNRNQAQQARWEKVSKHLGWYDYHYGMMYNVPRVYLRYQQEILQFGASHQVRYHTAELFPNWGEGPKPWVLAKLLWNPNADVESLTDDWCERAVGKPAARHLKAYYGIWEEFWTQTIIGTDFWNNSYGVDKFERQYLSYNDLRYLGEIPESFITDSQRHMNEVVQLAQTPAQQDRAKKLQLMWRFYRASYYAWQGEALAGKIDWQNEAQVLNGLERAEVYLAALTERRALLESFKDDPLYHDVYLRLRPDGARGSSVKWGHDLILKAAGLAKNNDAVMQKLNELSRNEDAAVRELAGQVLLEARP